ncbi:MAG: hypothetical protein CL675_07435 [Bdellovibrionaceae bacterium]|nr:hypothetical protein [Pseudobdellovibrionaceae bacterium]
MSNTKTEAAITGPHKEGLSVAIGLVHWPVLDRDGNTVCTNITNFDIHDIARVARAYGVEQYYLICKSREQLMFADRILDHWRTGYAHRFNPMRNKALERVKSVETLDVALQDWNRPTRVVATAARDLDVTKNISFQGLKSEMRENRTKSTLLLFGTGFGLTNQFLHGCDYLLEPIQGGSDDDYRHLSVRSAVSICLDRLL